jgi:hypothetical protein
MSDTTTGNVYTALVAALEHERACWADYQDALRNDRALGFVQGRWEDARDLAAELRALATRHPSDVTGSEEASDHA